MNSSRARKSLIPNLLAVASAVHPATSPAQAFSTRSPAQEAIRPHLGSGGTDARWPCRNRRDGIFEDTLKLRFIMDLALERPLWI
jgi:hypothetical protein